MDAWPNHQAAAGSALWLSCLYLLWPLHLWLPSLPTILCSCLPPGFSESLICQIKLFSQIFPCPVQRWNLLENFWNVGKETISQAWWVKFFHYQAALVIVLVDMFITPQVVAMFSDATGMRRSMLSTSARLGTMWFGAVLSTVYLTTHCMNGWTQLWNVSGWQPVRQFAL